MIDVATPIPKRSPRHIKVVLDSTFICRGGLGVVTIRCFFQNGGPHLGLREAGLDGSYTGFFSTQATCF